jgi:hypothetical protein
MAKISSETMSALRMMGEKTHTNSVMGNPRSVFVECPCTKCLDGGIDMLHCARCNRDNVFKHFRRKVKR